MMETTLVERFSGLIGFAIVSGMALAVIGPWLSRPKLAMLGGLIFLASFLVAFVLGLIDNDALTPILDATLR